MPRTPRLRSRLTVERMEDRLVPAGIPALDSNPGAAAAIYLDFDGHFEPTWLGYSNITTPAYDRDGNPAAVSDDEAEFIRGVWARVAEDFAPFNVNVTTAEPAVLAPGRPIADANKKALRVSIGGDGMWYQNGAYGGVGAYNSFTNATANVCFVFAQPTSGLNWVGDVSSHEAGHSFGLYHQSEFDPNGAEEDEYFNGEIGKWSPIMGSHLSNLSIWYNGTTTSAATLQDDLAMLANTTNGFGYRADDHGSTAATATPLTATGPNAWTRTGIVGTNTDVDYFSFTLAAADTLRVAAAGPGVNANLDAVVELRTASGQLLEAADPTGSLNAALVRSLAAGTYTVAVRSSGIYGRIGSYTVTVDAPPAGITVTPATSALTTAEDGRGTSFTVVLQTAPVSNVVIPIGSTNATEGGVSVSSLTFTPVNWNVPQTVTITGVNDAAVDGDAAYTVVIGAAVSTDPEYAGRDSADLAAVNLDDDAAGFIYSTDATADVIYRSRLDGSYREVILDLKAAFGGLDYGPTRLVADEAGGKLYWIDATTDWIYRVNIDGSAPERVLNVATWSAGVAAPSGLALDTAAGKMYWTDQYNGAKWVRRANLDGSGAELLVATTGIPSGIALDPMTGTMYWTEANGTVASVRRANLDGTGYVALWTADGPSYSSGVAVDPAAGKVYWAHTGGHGVWRMNLDGSGVEVAVPGSALPPGAGVSTFTLDTTAGTLYMRYTAGGMILRANLNGSGVVGFPWGSSATAVQVVRPAAGVSVSGHAGLTTTEGAGSAAFRVVLTSRPTANVTIPVSSGDTTEGTVSVSSLTFTPANWSVPQTVTVTSVDDAATDGNIAYAVVLGAAVSGDPVYHGVNPTDATVTNADNDFNKFYVADDASTDRTYRYGATVNSRSNSALGSGNTAPRGAATTAAGDKLWVVDANKKVYVYNSSTGALLGSWNANSLPSNATVEGVAVWGADVWLVDARGDKVYRYANAASRTSGSQSATSSFALHANNIGPKDLVTDGVSIWVVDDQTLDRVYKYTLSGTYVGRWDIDPANGSPTGITLDPTNPRHLWIVDNVTDRVYQYDNAVSRTSGAQSASTSTALAAGNTNPQGIADPPPLGESVGVAASRSAESQVDLPARSGHELGVSPPDAVRLHPARAVSGTAPSFRDALPARAVPPRRADGLHNWIMAVGEEPDDIPMTWGIWIEPEAVFPERPANRPVRR